MLTYVINTSENKTFDSSTLFEITGYNKIRWMHCSLDEIQSCAQSIFEKQNVLGAEHFRVAVIVDFYNFDKVRKPYGRTDFVEDPGVDLSIYMPYIEVYLMDNLVAYLEKKDLYAADFEVYYVQNEKSERFDLFENANGQLKKILSGDEPFHTYTNEERRARDAAAKAVKRIPSKSGTAEEYPDIAEIKCRPIEKWHKLNMTWQGSDVVVSIPLSSKWTVRDAEPNEHLIYSDGIHIGNIFIEESSPAIKKLFNKHCTLGNVTMDYDLRLVEEDEEFVYRYVFTFSFTEKDHENKAVVEINYDQMDEDALAHILKELLVSTTEDRSFDGKFMQVNDVFYTSFTLYCTPDVSLKFKLSDYPYGASEMTFTQFWKAFCNRQALRMDLKRHYYIVPYGGGPSRAALDTLSLSLYLIRMYEREEMSSYEGDMEVFHLDSNVLKEVLEESWSKVNTAKALAKSSEIEFYQLTQVDAAKRDSIPREETAKEYISKQRSLIRRAQKGKNPSAELLYSKVGEITDRDLASLTEKNRRDFDEVMTEYLSKRDGTKEASSKEEFNNLKNSGLLKTTAQCPSKEEYNHVINEKQKDISNLFQRILSSEYIKVDFSEERKNADAAYKQYQNAKACLNRNIIGDIIFMILAVAAMIVPYIVFQLTSYRSTVFSSTALGLYMTGVFAGTFVLAVLLQMVPLMRKMNQSKLLLKKCYIDCLAKENYAFSAIRRKYEKDLIAIEQQRYDIRQIKQIYATNVAKERNIALHREMLEKLEDCLSSILNNLDVEPKFTILESLDGELDFGKPVQDKVNKIYHVFSVETIEKMFPKKGSD